MQIGQGLPAVDDSQVVTVTWTASCSTAYAHVVPSVRAQATSPRGGGSSHLPVRYHSVPPPTCLLSSTVSSQAYVDGTSSVSGEAAIPQVQEEEDPFGHLNLDSFGGASQSQPMAGVSLPRAGQSQPSVPSPRASNVSELLQAPKRIEEEQR